MPKKKTLEDLNTLVESLAEQYRLASQKLADAMLLQGDMDESIEAVRFCSQQKQKLWQKYTKAKKEQAKMRAATIQQVKNDA